MSLPNSTKLQDLANLVAVRNHLGLLVAQRNVTNTETYKLLNGIQLKLDREFISACLRLEEPAPEPELEPEQEKVVAVKKPKGRKAKNKTSKAASGANLMTRKRSRGV